LSFEEYLNENFEEIEFEDLKVNENQRILLVGFSIDEPRENDWMAFWQLWVGLNAIILKYIKTRGGDEFIART